MRYFEIITETKIHKVETDNGFIRVYENPISDVVKSMGNSDIRGFFDDDGNLYIWNAYQATHDQIADELSLNWSDSFTFIGSVSNNVIEGTAELEELLDNKYFKRAFKHCFSSKS